MPKRQLVIMEKTEGGYDWAEEGIILDPKTQQPIVYKKDGVCETEKGLYDFMALWLGLDTKRAK